MPNTNETLRRPGDDLRTAREPRDVEHLDVLVVGAGLSGVCAGHHLQTEAPWARYAIFEARAAMGGTWDLFRYPGVRSDSDMFTLGFPFRPWKGDRMLADGPSIRRYIEETAAEEGIDRHIRFHHRVLSADWSSDEALWHVTAERSDTGETVQLTCSFLFACSGYYRYDHGYQPDFPGTESFRGRLLHPQQWPENLDYTAKRVVVIGSGATAITLVPAMADRAAHVTMLQRSPTYVVSVPEHNPVVSLFAKLLPGGPAATVARWVLAVGTQAFYFLAQRYPHPTKRILRRGVERQLPRGYDVATHFTPRYNPWDERMCVVPGGDLFRAIRDGKASVVTDEIATFTETGLRLRSGTTIEADIVVSATGLELLFLGGISVSVDGEPVELANRLVYQGMMVEGLPNLAFAIGYTNASWTLKADLTASTVARVLNHLRESGNRECMPVNADSSVRAEPLLGLKSGYIQRAADRMPKQGTKFPWQVYQSFWRDFRAMRLGRIDDGVLQFSNPVPAKERAVA
ncbi:MAG: flavin-containing monooxygenase [Acidimicrobiia bacterium]